MQCANPGADPEFWFGRGSGRGLGDGSPLTGSRGRAPVWVWGRRILHHEAKKTTYEETKTSPYRLTLYDNIISSIHRFMFPAIFCLRIQNVVCGLQSQRNGPQWQPGLIKGVS